MLHMPAADAYKLALVRSEEVIIFPGVTKL